MILSLHGVEGGWKGTEVTGRLYSWQPVGDRQPPCHSWGGRDCASHGVSLNHTALKALLGLLFLPFSPWRFLMDLVPFHSHCPCQTETVPILSSFISNRINSLYVYIAEIT